MPGVGVSVGVWLGRRVGVRLMRGWVGAAVGRAVAVRVGVRLPAGGTAVAGGVSWTAVRVGVNVCVAGRPASTVRAMTVGMYSVG